ncbi:MAG: ABC transporter ATP-binding protein [Suilimivivens sp.]
MSKELLKVTDLNIEFHDHLIPETVVYDFDLTLNEGEIVGLVGESGSGKSMSALAIAGLLSRRDMRKRGEILFEGVDLLTCERSILRQIQGNDISVIFQEPMTSLNPVKKIGWQVEESLRIHTDLSKEERYKRAVQMLADVELDEPERVYHQYPHELSGGMRQRVMIAAAMICTPKILIADEPTTALDVTIQAQIVDLLKRINREKKTAILFISHDLSLVKQLCERVLVMKNGYIVESGPAEEVFEHPKEEYTQKLIAAIPKVVQKKDK